jgi:hypothetical protein
MADKQEITTKQEQLLQGLQEEESAYMDFLQRLKPEKRQRITNSLNRMRHGLHTVAPLTCMGPRKCPFINHCPIPSVEEKQARAYGGDEDYPMMMPCVLETMYQRQKILEYVQHLEVHPDNPVEMAIVNELAIIDLYKNRALMITSEGDRDGEGRDFLRQDRDWKEAGDEAYEVFTTALHPTFDVLDRLERRRERLLERLMETRQARANYDLKRGKVQEDSNVLKEIAAVRKYLEEASRRSLAGTGDEDQAIMVDD